MSSLQKLKEMDGSSHHTAREHKSLQDRLARGRPVQAVATSSSEPAEPVETICVDSSDKDDNED